MDAPPANKAQVTHSPDVSKASNVQPQTATPQPVKTVPPQPSQTPTQQPKTATAAPPPKSTRKLNFKLIGIVTFVLILIVGFFIYRGSQGRLEVDEVQPEVSPAPNLESPDNYQTIGIPTNWTMQKSTECNVAFPLPPKDPQMPEGGRYWRFEEYEASIFMFNTTARVIYGADDVVSGFVADSVEMICSPNTKGVTTEQLLANLEALLEGQLPAVDNIAIKTSRNSLVWSHDVKALTFEGGVFDPEQEYYMFATPQHLYFVRKVVQAEEESIIDITGRVFSNLQFLE